MMFDYNNYVEANSALIQSQFSLFGNAVGDYHRDTPKVSGVTGNTRCSRGRHHVERGHI